MVKGQLNLEKGIYVLFMKGRGCPVASWTELRNAQTRKEGKVPVASSESQGKLGLGEIISLAFHFQERGTVRC
jgi:hypothetical protein